MIHKQPPGAGIRRLREMQEYLMLYNEKENTALIYS